MGAKHIHDMLDTRGGGGGGTGEGGEGGEGGGGGGGVNCGKVFARSPVCARSLLISLSGDRCPF